MDTSVYSIHDFELIEPLNERELEILALFAEQRTNQEIADALFLSLNTVKWYARQIYGKLAVTNRQEAVERASQLGLLDETEPASESLPHNLPAQLTPFVGRQRELAELRRLLLDPSCRLLTITGPGGMGKTRLALEAASLLVQDPQISFGDGVFLSRLASLSDATSVVSAMADAMGFHFRQANSTPEEQLGQFLRQKSMLLVLDNFEHLIGEATLHFLTDLLATAPDVTVLVTTRVRLNIQGEQLFPLHGLDVPQSVTQGETEVIATDGVKLFADAARRADPTFVLNSTNLSPVVAICRLVEGMPLAIELAAAWTAVLEPAEILKEIHSGLDFLASDAVNVPARQRSLPVVLRASWQLLSEAEREGMRKMSIFRGGFTSDTARQVAEVSPKTLLGLVGKSWLQRDAGGRYQVHELLRQYGAAELERNPTQEAAARTQHSLFYCQWLASLDEGRQKRDQQASLNTIAVELENMRSACFWAAQQGLTERLDQALPTLGLFYRWQGGFVAGDHTFARLSRELAGATDESGLHALAQIKTWRCVYRAFMGDRNKSLRLADEVLAILASPVLQQRETQSILAHIELILGYETRFAPAESKSHFIRSYELSEEIDDRIGMAFASVGLGHALRNNNQIVEAESAIRRGICLHESTEFELGYGNALAALGTLAYMRMRFDEAERLLKQSLAASYESTALFWLACTYRDSGRLVKAIKTMEECLSLHCDRGTQGEALATAVHCAMIHRDLGALEKARELGEEILVEYQSIDYKLGYGRAVALLGSIDLLEGDAQSAFERLQEGVVDQLAEGSVWASTGNQAWLGLAARVLGRREAARRHILAELDWALRFQIHVALFMALSGLALLLADDGEVVQAVELHALLLEHPYTAHVHWFSEIITPDITIVAAALSEAQRSAAEERGRAQDLWEVAAKLAGDLAEQG